MTENASDLIDERIASLGDWRGETLARLRSLIREADPGIVETVKWRKPSNPGRRAGVGARWDRLHRRNIRRQGQADFRQGRLA